MVPDAAAYLLLLPLQDFSRDLMLISKKRESCRLSMVRAGRSGAPAAPPPPPAPEGGPCRCRCDAGPGGRRAGGGSCRDRALRAPPRDRSRLRGYPRSSRGMLPATQSRRPSYPALGSRTKRLLATTIKRGYKRLLFMQFLCFSEF